MNSDRKKMTLILTDTKLTQPDLAWHGPLDSFMLIISNVLTANVVRVRLRVSRRSSPWSGFAIIGKGFMIAYCNSFG